MQNEMFLPKAEARINHLRGLKKTQLDKLKSINEELQVLVKSGTTELVGVSDNGEKTYLCMLPTGGTYLFREGEKELFQLDIDLMSDAINKIRNRRQ